MDNIWKIIDEDDIESKYTRNICREENIRINRGAYPKHKTMVMLQERRKQPRLLLPITDIKEINTNTHCFFARCFKADAKKLIYPPKKNVNTRKIKDQWLLLITEEDGLKKSVFNIEVMTIKNHNEYGPIYTKYLTESVERIKSSLPCLVLPIESTVKLREDGRYRVYYYYLYAILTVEDAKQLVYCKKNNSNIIDDMLADSIGDKFFSSGNGIPKRQDASPEVKTVTNGQLRSLKNILRGTSKTLRALYQEVLGHPFQGRLITQMSSMEASRIIDAHNRAGRIIDRHSPHIRHAPIDEAQKRTICNIYRQEGDPFTILYQRVVGRESRTGIIDNLTYTEAEEFLKKHASKKVKKLTLYQEREIKSIYNEEAISFTNLYERVIGREPKSELIVRLTYDEADAFIKAYHNEEVEQ